MTPAYVAEDIKTVYNLSLRFVQCNLQAFAYTLFSDFSPRGSSIQMVKFLTRVLANHSQSCSKSTACPPSFEIFQ